MYDVVIVGAGSAGLNTAINCAKRGMNVAVIEEHQTPGFPRHCSGLYSTRITKFLDIKNNFCEHEVDGARFHSPSGKTVELTRDKTAAFVIDREKMDNHLSNLARESGAEILTNTKVIDVDTNHGSANVRTEKEIITSKLICAADGSNSIIAKKLGITPPKKLHGIMAIAKDEDYSRYVDLYFDNKLYPGFFAWKIPRGKTIEYGIVGEIGPKNVDNFNTFLEKMNVREYELSSGVIPMGFQKTFSNRILFVGDAGAQVKPLTGGGVIYGMVCARIAAHVFERAILQNRFDEKFLSSYEQLWKSRIGKGISRGLLIRKIYSRMPNSTINIAFGLLGNTTIKKLFEKYGDMEFVLERNPHYDVPG